jgi:hypothetical protein
MIISEGESVNDDVAARVTALAEVLTVAADHLLTASAALAAARRSVAAFRAQAVQS